MDFDPCSQQCLSPLLTSDSNTVVEQNVCCFCQSFVNATFQMIYFAYIAPAHQLTSTLFPPFFPFLSTLVSHFIPNFPLHLLASHSALPPNSSPSLPLAAEAQLLRTSHKDRDVSSFIYWHLFSKVVPHQLYSTSYT